MEAEDGITVTSGGTFKITGTFRVAPDWETGLKNIIGGTVYYNGRPIGVVTGTGAPRFKYGDMVRYKDGSGTPMMIVRGTTEHDGDVLTIDFDDLNVLPDLPDVLELIP